MTDKEYEALFEEFRNNVFCRHDSNQHKAKALWAKLKHLYTQEAVREFEVDWAHYMTNALQYNGFEIGLVQLRLGKK